MTSKLGNLSQAKVLHIELTTACQAACPQCARMDPNLYDHQNPHSLSFREIVDLVPEEVVKQLDKVYFCGNFGDPCASVDLLPVIRYFRSYNPEIVIGINTNGALRNENFWINLAALTSNERDYVVFSIDGLSDTNHIYRKNVDWNKLMQNASTYIAWGGNAHWDMLVYDHNEHQVAEAEQLARDMKFKWFRAKISKRFSTRPIKFLNPPKGMETPKPIVTDKIDCFALKEQSVYLSATGEFLPCCWMGDYIFARDADIDEAVASGTVESRFDTNPLPICKQTCSVADEQTNFKQQWRIEKEL